MKIVNIEDFFHPDAGYQINILSKYLAEFGHEVVILTSEMTKIPDKLTSFFGRDHIEERDRTYTEKTGVQIIRLPLLAFVSGRAVFGRELEKKVTELKPDVLFVHGNDTLSGIRYIMKARRLPYALVTDSHMLEMASANRFNKVFRAFYKRFITPKIIKHGIPVIRTQDDLYVEKQLGIPLGQAPWISYGSDTLLFHPDKEARMKFRAENDIAEDDFVVVYTGKLDEGKGGMLLAKAFQHKFSTSRPVVLVVVGNTVGSYGEEVERVFNGSENRVVRFSTQKYADLAPFYQAADLSVFPKQCSLSFYDAQACGLPVLSEDNNINVDRCSHGNGWNFEAGSVDDFRNKIEWIAGFKPSNYVQASQRAHVFILEGYDYYYKAKEYEKVILDAQTDFNRRKKI